jgi:hypothetical protein
VHTATNTDPLGSTPPATPFEPELIVGKDHLFDNHTAVKLLCCALPLFVISALIALMVQTYGWKYSVVDPDSLTKIVSDEFWNGSADLAARDDADQRANTTRTLRCGNNQMATSILVSLGFSRSSCCQYPSSRVVGADLSLSRRAAIGARWMSLPE